MTTVLMSVFAILAGLGVAFIVTFWFVVFLLWTVLKGESE